MIKLSEEISDPLSGFVFLFRVDLILVNLGSRAFGSSYLCFHITVKDKGCCAVSLSAMELSMCGLRVTPRAREIIGRVPRSRQGVPVSFFSTGSISEVSPV